MILDYSLQEQYLETPPKINTIPPTPTFWPFQRSWTPVKGLMNWTTVRGEGLWSNKWGINKAWGVQKSEWWRDTAAKYDTNKFFVNDPLLQGLSYKAEAIVKF